MSPRNQAILAACAVLSVLGVGSLVYWIATAGNEDTPSPDVKTVNREAWETPLSNPSNEPTPDQRFTKLIEHAKTEQEKVAALESLPRQTWAVPGIVGVRAILLREKSEAVRQAAFQAEYELTGRDSTARRDGFLADCLMNPNANVRHSALRAAQGTDNAELVDRVVQYIDSGAQDGFVALTTLAKSPVPAAQAKVLAASKDETLPRAERIRAVSLLMHVKTDEARDYLAQLISGDDTELARIAAEALRSTPSREGH